MVLDRDVLAFDGAGFAEAFAERSDTAGIRRTVADESDDRNWLLLRARRERPCSRAAKQRDEGAPLHSITSSARARSIGGIWTPSALAVVRLITRANVVGCSTGKSLGLAPRRILST